MPQPERTTQEHPAAPRSTSTWLQVAVGVITILTAGSLPASAQLSGLPSDTGTPTAPPKTAAKPSTVPPPTPGPGEYSLKGETGEVLHPKAPTQQGIGLDTELPTGWIRMKLLYTDQPPPGTEPVLQAWARTKPQSFQANHGTAVLYQVYEQDDRRIIALIGLSPACMMKNFVTLPGSKLTGCPAYASITYRERPPKLIAMRSCFQWNGQAPPGSPLDPRKNSDYTLYDPTKQTLSIWAIKAGEPVLACKAEFDLSDHTEDPGDG